MTAEVAILNRNAVAIAADSAATVSRSDGDRAEESNEPATAPKVYNTANKLFALSHAEPVAVMVYDGGEFAGIPWDTVVKLYRRDLHKSSFGTVDEYADRFSTFLEQLLERFDLSGRPSTTGVVFAGFGTEQLFPALSHYGITTDANGMTIEGRGKIVIGDTTEAAIQPFAQNYMVATFMEGTFPGYRDAFQGFVEDRVSSMAGELAGWLGDDQGFEEVDLFKQKTTVLVSDILQDLTGLGDTLGRRLWSRIMDTVEWLPKEDLAATAEALVSLTSLWQRVTPGSETVGGPVDVAVISKGDGLVWIRRKHYFNPELNFRYFERNRLA